MSGDSGDSGGRGEGLERKNISFLELEVFVTVGRLGSVRAAARRLGLTASNASKIISRLEKKVERPLLRRAPTGVILTREALSLLEPTAAVIEMFENSLAATESRSVGPAPMQILTIGSLSHLNKHVLAPLVSGLEATPATYRFRLLDVPPDQISVLAAKGVLDLVVHTSKLALGKLWSTSTVGKIEWGFFGRVNHPLGAVTSKEQIKRYPFIVPTYWQDGGFAVGSDYCPIPWAQRIKGHEASTAETAAELIAWSDQIAYLPKTIVSRHARGVVELVVEDATRVVHPVHLAVQRDQVTARLQKALAGSLRSWLER